MDIMRQIADAVSNFGIERGTAICSRYSRELQAAIDEVMVKHFPIHDEERRFWQNFITPFGNYSRTGFSTSARGTITSPIRNYPRFKKTKDPDHQPNGRFEVGYALKQHDIFVCKEWNKAYPEYAMALPNDDDLEFDPQFEGGIFSIANDNKGFYLPFLHNLCFRGLWREDPLFLAVGDKEGKIFKFHRSWKGFSTSFDEI